MFQTTASTSVISPAYLQLITTGLWTILMQPFQQIQTPTSRTHLHASPCQSLTLLKAPTVGFSCLILCLLLNNVDLYDTDVEGELVRFSGVEDLVGIGMLMDVQLIDVETCEPVPNQYVEFWQANQTVSPDQKYMFHLL
jgi:hypothetical protein